MFKECYIEQYLIFIKAGHPISTVLSYTYALRPLDKWLNARGYALLKLTPVDIANYQIDLQNSGLKGGTRSHYVTTLRGLWKWLRLQNLVSWTEELIEIPDRSDTISHACLRTDEFEKMLAVFHEFIPKDLRDKLIIRLFMLTGARLSEIANEFLVTRLDMEKQRARIKTYKRKNHFRYIYWDEETNRLLKKWLEIRECLLQKKAIVGCQHVFISLDSGPSNGQPLQRYGYQRAFSRARTTANIRSKITPHSARHGHGTILAENGVDLYELKEDMGHANIKNTMIYVHLKDEKIQRAHKNGFDRAFKNM